jgi:hypothetical protein
VLLVVQISQRLVELLALGVVLIVVIFFYGFMTKHSTDRGEVMAALQRPVAMAGRVVVVGAVQAVTLAALEVLVVVVAVQINKMAVKAVLAVAVVWEVVLL